MEQGWYLILKNIQTKQAGNIRCHKSKVEGGRDKFRGCKRNGRLRHQLKMLDHIRLKIFDAMLSIVSDMHLDK